MKLFLDDYSRIILPQLHNKYQETRKVLLQLKNNLHSESNAEIKHLKYKSKVQNEHLAYASFGIEHFFREIGQIYEARMENSDTKEKVIEEIRKLPQIMAHLVNDGYAMEIMDGDASHVPITWVKAV